MLVKMQVKVPSLPGVYFFLNKNSKILYIGKAANLKDRLSSYFQKNQISFKTKSLLKEATKIEWKILGSATETLIKESELIKKYQPKYNVLMRDDKQYFFVAFTKEEYPKIFLTHQPTKNYLGPFTDGAATKSVLKLLRKTFPYCTCKHSHKGLCLNARIGRCLGYCCLISAPTTPFLLTKEKSWSEIYKKNINSIKKILSGKNKTLLKSLKRDMKKHSLEQLFEKAVVIRDQIRALEKIFAHKEMISRDMVSENIKAISALELFLKIKEIKKIEAFDIANIQGKYAYGSMVVFTEDAPAKDLYRIFKIKTVSSSNDVAMLKEVLTRRLSHKEWQYPEVILVDGGKPQFSTANWVISNFKFSIFKPKIIALTKNKKHVGDHIFISGRGKPIPLSALPLPLKNLLLNLDSEAHRFAIKHYRQLHRKMLT